MLKMDKYNKEHSDSLKNPEKYALVIDDEIEPRRILKRVLESLNYTVWDFSDPFLLDEYLKVYDIELITMDIIMPGVNALDTVSVIHGKYPQTMIIMITAVLDTEIAIEAMKRGAIDYIVKPFNLDAVAMSVERAQRMYHLQMENKKYKESLEALVLQRTEQVFAISEELQQKNKELIEANRYLSEMNEKLEYFFHWVMTVDKMSTLGLLSSMLIHSITNPLSVIKGITEMVKKRYTHDSLTLHELQMMENYIQQLFDLVNHIKAFVKSEHSQYCKWPVQQIIANALLLLEHLATKNQVTLIFNQNSNPVYIHANHTQLIQVFVNIIQNAIQATGEKGKIKIQVTTNERQHAVITIEDNGPGIDPQHMKYILKTIFTTKTKEQGTGLGLYIAREIIERHGGLIELNSVPGQGTQVTIFLPLYIEKTP